MSDSSRERKLYRELLVLAEKVSQAHGPHYCGTCQDAVRMREIVIELKQERP